MSKPSSASQFVSGLFQSFQGLSLSRGNSPQSPPSSPQSPSKQQQTIEYKELKLVASKGKGAYGEVFEAKYREETVAVKVFDFRGELTQKERSEIIHEAELMESIRSKYLVEFRGFCWDPRYCIVMEYCHGGTLRARLDKTDQPVNPKEELGWIQQISYGVSSLHKVKILHRDLKGENILIDKYGNAKVGDLGLSVVKSTSASQSKSNGGYQLVGTLPWMAPELFSGQSHQMSSDVYSLGMIIWEIASRKLPFYQKMPAVVVGMVLAGKREEINPTWPSLFRNLILACWATDPTKRPTAEQVGNEFGAALAASEAVDQPLSSQIVASASRAEAAPKNKVSAPEEKNKSASASNPHRITSAATPKEQSSPDPLKLQNSLVNACEQGDLKQVLILLIQGADVKAANSAGKKPLAAAVWGMNPDVVNELLKQTNSVSPMSWAECEKHNLAHYKEVFILPTFAPQRFGEWKIALEKMQASPFLKEVHIKDNQEQWPGGNLTKWEELVEYISFWQPRERMGPTLRQGLDKSERRFLNYIDQIKQAVNSGLAAKLGF